MSRTNSPPPLRGKMRTGDLHPAPPPSWRGFWFCRCGSPRCSAAMPTPVAYPRPTVSCNGWCSTPFGPEATQAQRWLKCQPSSYVRLEGLWLFWVIRGGIGLTRRLRAECSTRRLMSAWILSLEPERRRTDGRPPRHENQGSPGVLCNAQAACVFSCSASKRSSFFQRVKAMAAIFRAKVRRAISGFMPLSSKAT